MQGHRYKQISFIEGITLTRNSFFINKTPTPKRMQSCIFGCCSPLHRVPSPQALHAYIFSFVRKIRQVRLTKSLTFQRINLIQSSLRSSVPLFWFLSVLFFIFKWRNKKFSLFGFWWIHRKTIEKRSFLSLSPLKTIEEITEWH